MSTSERVARGLWPLPMMAPVLSERTRLTNQTVELLGLDMVEASPAMPSVSRWRARKATVEAALSLLAHELIPMAEQLIEATGAQRKALVKADLMKLVDALQARVKLGRLAWWLIRRAVDGIIEVALRQLEARGVVNVGRG